MFIKLKARARAILLSGAYLLVGLFLTQSACALTEPRNCRGQQHVIEHEGLKINFERYTPRQSSDRAILMMPPTNGVTPLETRYKWAFCRAGYVVYVVETWTGIDEVALELEVHNRLLGRGQAAIDGVLTQISEPYIALFGTSVGGIHGATALGRVDEINAAFLVAAGHPVASVIARSELGEMRDIRERRIRSNGWNGIDEYERALIETIYVEPGRYAEVARKKQLGVAIVDRDVTVHTDLQQALARDLDADLVINVSGRSVPGVSWLVGGGAHVAGIFRTWWFHEEEIIQFFDRSYSIWKNQ